MDEQLQDYEEHEEIVQEGKPTASGANDKGETGKVGLLRGVVYQCRNSVFRATTRACRPPASVT